MHSTLYIITRNTSEICAMKDCLRCFTNICCCGGRCRHNNKCLYQFAKVEQGYHKCRDMSSHFQPSAAQKKLLQGLFANKQTRPGYNRCSDGQTYKARRPSRARLSVPSSAYSRSPPMGRPRASVVICKSGSCSSFLISSRMK